MTVPSNSSPARKLPGAFRVPRPGTPRHRPVPVPACLALPARRVGSPGQELGAVTSRQRRPAALPREEPWRGSAGGAESRPPRAFIWELDPLIDIYKYHRYLKGIISISHGRLGPSVPCPSRQGSLSVGVPQGGQGSAVRWLRATQQRLLQRTAAAPGGAPHLLLFRVGPCRVSRAGPAGAGLSSAAGALQRPRSAAGRTGPPWRRFCPSISSCLPGPAAAWRRRPSARRPPPPSSRSAAVRSGAALAAGAQQRGQPGRRGGGEGVRDALELCGAGSLSRFITVFIDCYLFIYLLQALLQPSALELCGAGSLSQLITNMTDYSFIYLLQALLQPYAMEKVFHRLSPSDRNHFLS